MDRQGGLLGRWGCVCMGRRNWHDIGVIGKLTWIHPLHAIRECVVGNEVIASPSGVCDDRVCGCECCCAEQR